MKEYAMQLSGVSKCYVSGVRKKYTYTPVLRGADLDVPRGAILGLMGTNGAGKSTLIKIALGLLRPDSGEATILGAPAWNPGDDVKQRIGYVPQVFSGLRWMKVHAWLAYVGAFYARWNEAKAKALVGEWGLNPDARLRDLSEGELQKLSIIQALGHEPDLFVFDEPVASLDPLARRQFIKQLIDLNMDEGRTMLLSTHIASDLERAASDVAILKDGVIAMQGDFATLQERIRRLHIRAEHDLPQPLPAPKAMRAKIDRNSAVLTVDGMDDAEIAALQQKLNATVTVESLNLEEIFMEVHR